MNKDQVIFNRKFGLIGKSLDHSFSPKYFESKFASEDINDAEYKLYPLNQISEIRTLLSQQINGLNVTVPYKQEIINYLDDLDEVSREIGAVNTIAIVDGKTKGYNTDVHGFKKSLLNFLEDDMDLKAMVLGTGGASNAVIYVLKKLGMDFTQISRSKSSTSYDKINERMVTDHRLIINCTPLGMHPEVVSCPDIPYNYISEKHYLFDLIYNPEKTLFLKKGESKGARITNGYMMLCIQADKSWDIWNKEH